MRWAWSCSPAAAAECRLLGAGGAAGSATDNATDGATDRPGELVARLLRWRDAFAEGRVSGSLPYDLRQPVEDEPLEALVGASRRLFERRGLDGPDYQALRDDVDAHWLRSKDAGLGVQAAARALADELYLCRWLGAQPRPAQPPPAAAPIAEPPPDTGATP